MNSYIHVIPAKAGIQRLENIRYVYMTILRAYEVSW